MDKRKSKRINKRLVASFGTEELQHTGITNDISETGLFIKTTRSYQPGSILKINLLLPNNGSTTFTGKVVRTYMHPPFTSLARNGVGIELDSEETAYLTHIMNVEE